VASSTAAESGVGANIAIREEGVRVGVPPLLLPDSFPETVSPTKHGGISAEAPELDEVAHGPTAGGGDEEVIEDSPHIRHRHPRTIGLLTILKS
jgi:hypothetical protein